MKKLIFLFIQIISVTSFVRCNDGDEKTYAVKIAENPSFGKILTDGKGATLYFFSRDTKGTSSCDGNCLANWPPFFHENITVVNDLAVADFTTISRPDGTLQTSYKGYPLYYYIGDEKAGDTKGDKVNNVWYVAKPDYALMYGKAQLVGHDGKSYVANYGLTNYAEGQEETFYLTDAHGRTLYTFRNDKNGQNTFTTNPNNNSSVWPIFYTEIEALPTILNRSDFAEVTVNNQKQLTYKGWPLYYFGGNSLVSGDATRGDTRGVSFPMPGVWPIANTATVTAPD